jgi:hypothetical protein
MKTSLHATTYILTDSAQGKSSSFATADIAAILADAILLLTIA